MSYTLPLPDLSGLSQSSQRRILSRLPGIRTELLERIHGKYGFTHRYYYVCKKVGCHDFEDAVDKAFADDLSSRGVEGDILSVLSARGAYYYVAALAGIKVDLFSSYAMEKFLEDAGLEFEIDKLRLQWVDEISVYLEELL